MRRRCALDPLQCVKMGAVQFDFYLGQTDRVTGSQVLSVGRVVSDDYVVVAKNLCLFSAAYAVTQFHVLLFGSPSAPAQAFQDLAGKLSLQSHRVG